MSAGACLDEELLLRFVLHQLTDEELTRAEAHMRTCAICRRAVALLAETETGDPPSTPPDQLSTSSDPSDPSGPSSPVKMARKGKQIDRYVVLDVLGAGSMGVVYTAFDPQLDRKIALKMLRGDASDPDLAAERRARMMREAQAMARVSHPNVVRVHDVGAYQDQIFLAMELVQGQSLTRWQQAQQRTWREVLRVFIQAGRGLAAAHAAGLVHRDFKPDNVLLGPDGVARVMDFGLVHSVAPDPNAWKTPSPLPFDQSAEDELAMPLTQTGMLLGTPAYMAPEQWMGDKTDGRADQFSFCVSLYEALYGARPFSAKTLAELTSVVAQGKVNEAPPGSPVPFYLRRAVLKGLSPDPSMRYPSMDELLRVLEMGLRVPPRNWLYGGAALLVVGGLASAVPLYLDRREVARCSQVDTAFAGVWDGPARAALLSAYAQTQVGYAPEAFQRTAQLLDGYRSRWERARRRACAQLYLGDEPEALAGLRVECLDGKVDDLRALVEVLGKPDRQLVEDSVLAASRLGRPEDCADLRALSPGATPPPQPGVRERLRALRLWLARSRARAAAGQHGAARELARTALMEAEQVGHRPAEAEALLALGDAEQGAAELGPAQAAFSRALLAAEAAGYQKAAAEAAVKLVEVYASRGQEDLSEFFASMAAAQLERLGGDDALQARLEVASAKRLLGQRRLPQAEEKLRAALDLEERLYGPEHLEVSEALLLLGRVQQRQGRYRDALLAHGRALAALEAALGPGHPSVATGLTALGSTLELTGHFQQAVDQFRRAVELLEGTHGKGHPRVASALAGLSRSERSLGLCREAVEHARRALAIRRRALGPADLETGHAADLLGAALLAAGDARGAYDAHLEALRAVEKLQGPEGAEVPQLLDHAAAAALALGQLAEAERHARRALAAREKAEGADRAGASFAPLALAELLARAGRAEQAAQGFQRALELREEAFGEQSAQLVEPLLGLARGALQQRRPAEARAPLERLLKIDQVDPLAALDRAEVSFLLAQALGSGDPARARALAASAREVYARAGLDQRAAGVARWEAEALRPAQ